MVRFSETLSMKLSKEDRELLERQADNRGYHYQHMYVFVY